MKGIIRIFNSIDNKNDYVYVAEKNYRVTKSIKSTHRTLKIILFLIPAISLIVSLSLFPDNNPNVIMQICVLCLFIIGGEFIVIVLYNYLIKKKISNSENIDN